MAVHKEILRDPDFRERVDNAVEMALESLENPKEPGQWWGQPALWPAEEGWALFPDNAIRACPNAIELLADVPDPIDDRLQALAAGEGEWAARYRAAHVLARRGRQDVLPLPAMLIDSDRPDDRIAGWKLYYVAASNGVKFEIADIAERYAVEPERLIREEIAWVIGALRNRSAIEGLTAELEHADSAEVVWALGKIGDARAVPAIVKGYPGANRHYRLEALGRIGTPEAVEFIVDHIEDYGSAEALFLARSDRARAYLRGSGKDWRVYDAMWDQAEPTDELLRIAEDSRNPRDLRLKALQWAANRSDPNVQARVFEIFKSAPELRYWCLDYLEECGLQGVEDALMKYAMEEPERWDKFAAGEREHLIGTFNRRWRTYFHSIEQVRARISELRRAPTTR